MYQNIGFFQQTTVTYGLHCTEQLKRLMTLYKNLANFNNRKIFLIKCRSSGMFPNHIVNNLNCIITLQTESHPYKKDVDKMLKTIRQKILNMEIRIMFWKINNLKREIEVISREVQKILCNNTIGLQKCLLSSLLNRCRWCLNKCLIHETVI
ncbi:hypothetical protein ACFFRR_001279 [Megaselia abdita]